MDIIEYFSSKNKEHWLSKIGESDWNAGKFLYKLLKNSELKSAVKPENIARAACRAAVKAHDLLDRSAMERLLSDLKQCRQGTLCPHGRPTMITISTGEIEKRFQRK